MHDHTPSGERRLRVGSLLSRYGGLDLAGENVFDAKTIWFFVINEPVARHWPDALNLGDVTSIDWSAVEPMDILCGGFPCLNVKPGSEALGQRTRMSHGVSAGCRSGRDGSGQCPCGLAPRP